MPGRPPGSYRWLTVRVPGNGYGDFLEQPGSPLHDDATAAQLRELISKGAMSSLVLHTDDVRGLYETLQERGVTDFTRANGALLRHRHGPPLPFGNAIRILQQGKVAQKVTPDMAVKRREEAHARDASAKGLTAEEKAALRETIADQRRPRRPRGEEALLAKVPRW